MPDTHFCFCLRTHVELRTLYSSGTSYIWQLPSHTGENAYEDGKKGKCTTMQEKKKYCQALREFLLIRGNQIKREQLAACPHVISWNNVASPHWKAEGNTSPAHRLGSETSLHGTASCQTDVFLPSPPFHSTWPTKTPSSHPPPPLHAVYRQRSLWFIRNSMRQILLEGETFSLNSV